MMESDFSSLRLLMELHERMSIPHCERIGWTFTLGEVLHYIQGGPSAILEELNHRARVIRYKGNLYIINPTVTKGFGKLVCVEVRPTKIIEL